LHYSSEAEAAEKWNRRLKRINFNNLFFVFSPNEGEFKDSHMERFSKLPFKNKLIFSTIPREPKDITIVLQDYAGLPALGNVGSVYEKYLDVTAWLNGEKDFRRNGRAGQPWKKYIPSYK